MAEKKKDGSPPGKHPAEAAKHPAAKPTHVKPDAKHAEKAAPKPAVTAKPHVAPVKATKVPRPIHHRPKHVPPKEANVYSLSGEVLKSIELPAIFHAPLRPDLVRRAVVAAQANRRQPYGAMYNAGRRHSVRWAGKGQGVSRTPRIRGTMIGAQSPNTVGGAQAHPPRVEKVWAKKINDTERRTARAAALAAVREPRLVRARGHLFKEGLTLPVIVEDKLEKLETTEKALRMLTALGLDTDVTRAKEGTHIRAGRGKMRARRRREPSGPLIVVKVAGLAMRGFGNLAGVEVRSVDQLNTENLAPGGDQGRLTVFSEAAIEALRGA